jgi:hypothetical protein
MAHPMFSSSLMRLSGSKSQAYGVTQQKDLLPRRQLGARTPFASLIDEVGDRLIGDGL